MTNTNPAASQPSDEQIDAAAIAIGLAYGGREGDMRRLVRAVISGHQFQQSATLRDFLEHFDATEAYRVAGEKKARIVLLEGLLEAALREPAASQPKDSK